MVSWRILEGKCVTRLRELDAGSVQTCVTSPPYFGLRDYGHDGQIGLESTPEAFVAALVAVFAEVRRVLRDDGTLWLNLGDSYNNRAVNRPSSHQGGLGFESAHLSTSWRDHAANGRARMSIADGDLKEKDILGIPWMVAFALRADGWYLRSDIIWHKPNPMPESVTDRPTKAHEYLFLLSKSPRYFYDADAISEPLDGQPHAPGNLKLDASRNDHDSMAKVWGASGRRNKRSVWTVATQPYAGAHFATFPPKLVEPCILAGSAERACGECGAPWVRLVERTPAIVEPSARRAVMQEEQGDRARTNLAGTMRQAPSTRTVGWQPSCAHDDDTGHSVVLDPFAGSGTTGVVALRHSWSFVGIELNPTYAALARDRIVSDAPLLNAHAEVS